MRIVQALVHFILVSRGKDHGAGATGAPTRHIEYADCARI